MQTLEASSTDHAIARFLRTLSSAALQLAEDLETEAPGEQGPLPLDEANLGTLQRLIVRTPAIDSEVGVSPREITQQLDRDDEPNVRTALAAMEKRGITELVPGASPQRWRLAPSYSEKPGGPLNECCQRCGYQFAGPTVQEICAVKSACDRRLREPGYRVPKGRKQNMMIRDATLAAHPELGPTER
jgi:hypothetical protein